MTADSRDPRLLHLTKLAVGVTGVEHFHERVAARQATGMSIRTRMFPKRAGEIETGGSLYWVVVGFVAVRQRVLAIKEDTYADGTRCARIDLEPKLIAVTPQRTRPFQGWRYLSAEKAPADLELAATSGLEAFPADVVRQLRELCLV